MIPINASMDQFFIKLPTIVAPTTRGFPTVKPALPIDPNLPLTVIYIILYSGNFLRIKYKDWGEKRSKKFPKDGSDKILKQLEKENKELENDMRYRALK